MMRRLIVAASMLVCAVVAQRCIAAALNIIHGGGGGQVVVVAQTIASINLSNSTFTPGVANGTVGTVSVTMSSGPPFSGGLTIGSTGCQVPPCTNSGGFHLVGTTLEASASGTAVGTYADFTIVATQSGISNSPQQISPSLVGSDVTVNVQSGAVQQYGGLGFAWLPPNAKFDTEAALMPTNVWTEIFRRLFGPGHFTETRFYRDGAFTGQPDIGLLQIAKAQGMKDSVTVMEWCKSGNNTADANAASDVVVNIRNAGIPMTAISLANKPNATPWVTNCYTSTTIVDYIKILRGSLDARGLQAVRILAPETVEWSPPIADSAVQAHYPFQAGDTTLYFNALANDSVALAAVGAFDIHSYGTAVTTDLQNFATTRGKPFWVSMNTQPWYDNNNPYLPADAVSVADLLSDLNHGVTNWFYWTWATLINIQSLPQTVGAVQVGTLYDNLSNISGVFDIGAMVRSSTSSPALPTADMHYQYEQEPQIIAAAAKNPDGSWGIGLVNLTGVHTDVVQNPAPYDPSGSHDMTVQVCIQELVSAGPLTFHKNVTKSNVSGVNSGANAAMTNGCLVTILHALEIVTLVNR